MRKANQETDRKEKASSRQKTILVPEARVAFHQMFSNILLVHFLFSVNALPHNHLFFGNPLPDLSIFSSPATVFLLLSHYRQLCSLYFPDLPATLFLACQCPLYRQLSSFYFPFSGNPFPVSVAVDTMQKKVRRLGSAHYPDA